MRKGDFFLIRNIYIGQTRNNAGLHVIYCENTLDWRSLGHSLLFILRGEFDTMADERSYMSGLE